MKLYTIVAYDIICTTSILISDNCFEGFSEQNNNFDIYIFYLCSLLFKTPFQGGDTGKQCISDIYPTGHGAYGRAH